MDEIEFSIVTVREKQTRRGTAFRRARLEYNLICTVYTRSVHVLHEPCRFSSIPVEETRDVIVLFLKFFCRALENWR